jgi:hypothetical protein
MRLGHVRALAGSPGRVVASHVGRKNPIREASFVGWPETFRWDHDGCASVRSPRASLQRFADVSVSLMPKENSLFGRINSLFRQNFSLFDCVGNSIKKGNQYERLGRCIRANQAQNRENSLYFPWISGNRTRRMVRL